MAHVDASDRVYDALQAITQRDYSIDPEMIKFEERQIVREILMVLSEHVSTCEDYGFEQFMEDFDAILHRSSDFPRLSDVVVFEECDEDDEVEAEEELSDASCNGKAKATSKL